MSHEGDVPTYAHDIKTMGRMLRQIEDPSTRRLFEVMLGNIDTIKKGIDALENPEEPPFFDCVLLNGWVQFGADWNSPQFHLGIHGDVHIHGLIKDGATAIDTPLFVLPVGFRPNKKILFDVISQGAQGRVDVWPDGNVVIVKGNSNYLSFDGIIYHAQR